MYVQKIKGGVTMTELQLMRDIGENIEMFLEDSNMSQSQLAKEVGISKSTISRYINGEMMPTLKTLINIAYVLLCDVGDLLPNNEFIK